MTLGLVSAIFGGCGLAQVRILCGLKYYRGYLGQYSHGQLKVWFWSLLMIILVSPAFMYPSVAIQEQAATAATRYSVHRGIYFIVSGVL